MKKVEKSKGRKIPIKIDYPTPRGNIKLKVLGLPKDLYIFTRLDAMERSKICHEFISLARIRTRTLVFKKPRGRYKDSRSFTSRMRVLATETYPIVRHLLENRSQTQFVRNLIKEYQKEYNPHSREPEKFEPKPHELTAFIMESIFGNERKKFRIKEWTEDVENFRRTYITTGILRTRDYKRNQEFLLRSFECSLQEAGDNENPLKAFRIFYGSFFNETRFEDILNPHK